MGHTTNAPAPQAPAAAAAAGQVHDKFKVFIPEENIAYDEAMRRLGNMVASWSAEGKVAPKSVGIEYLEGPKRLVLSIGYKDNEKGYPVKLTSKSLGKPQLFPDAIEAVMSKAAADVQNVICHEFFVTGDGEFVMVLMSHG
jgi:hypothetical protein